MKTPASLDEKFDQLGIHLRHAQNLAVEIRDSYDPDSGAWQRFNATVEAFQEVHRALEGRAKS